MNKVYKIFLSIGFLWSSQAHATQMIYQPVNPNFGGASSNASLLMNEAKAIDTFTDPNAPAARAPKSALNRFQENLQQFILNRVASSVTGKIIDASGNLIPGKISTQDFVIDVIDSGSGTLKIITTDKNTGQSTTFTIN